MDANYECSHCAIVDAFWLNYSLTIDRDVLSTKLNVGGTLWLSGARNVRE